MCIRDSCSLLLIHLILRTSPHHSHHIRSHHMSLFQPFIPDVKLISEKFRFRPHCNGALVVGINAKLIAWYKFTRRFTCLLLIQLVWVAVDITSYQSLNRVDVKSHNLLRTGEARRPTVLAHLTGPLRKKLSERACFTSRWSFYIQCRLLPRTLMLTGTLKTVENMLNTNRSNLWLMTRDPLYRFVQNRMLFQKYCWK